MDELKANLKAACKKLFGVDIEPELTRPEEKFGDYATNLALQLGKQLGKNPRQVAEQLAQHVRGETSHMLEVNVAGEGFINFTLTDEVLSRAVTSATKLSKPLDGQEILVEFGDPNPFKEMHIGHLYSYIVGDSISKLLETSGATVRRLSYHGDVGLHVARAIFGLRELEKESKDRNKSLSDIPVIERENFLGIAYAYGADKYENDQVSRREMDVINVHIYDKDDPEINELHEKGCELSFSYFDKILDLLSIPYDKRYLESDTASIGIELVRKHHGTVFKESHGAVIYEGERVGLHTRVFITSTGLPTYETKDLGLVTLKNRDFPGAHRSIVITAHEQSEYFKVMLAALSEIDTSLAQKTSHLSHGFLSLSTGKMSSRTGNVYAALTLIEQVEQSVRKQFPNSDASDKTDIAALKYGWLKHRLGSDIVFNIAEAVSLEGNSGPYLQYAHARACSIIQKAGVTDEKAKIESFEPKERSLARKISEYPEVVKKATDELMPHYICTYLYELAQTFNSFYESNRIIGNERQGLRLGLVKNYQEVLENGLGLLNIAAPESI
ncbi:arginine--tRNA ligase [Candidatus Saccharibacteria bacterium CG10_big_fil_rev_8_21_14_0_10_47_8]|nr:MAG: arginine--tRNA ligase [Candidatus Saccharibacteria bacterium CG10_big_fil_rev_8_21_14_0_10_47_8]